jgi:uncharacterized protein (DUF1919 family)
MTSPVQIFSKVIRAYSARKYLKNKDFSIISNNCLAGNIYRRFRLPYKSPTVGLFLFSADYVNFLERLDYYLKQPLSFTAVSKYAWVNASQNKKPYPIGLLGNDVEIHFLHYKTEQEAAEKWVRRVKRINFDNLFVIYSDLIDAFQPELIARYTTLNFERKVILSQPKWNDVLLMNTENGYFDVTRWLNGEKDYLKLEAQ